MATPQVRPPARPPPPPAPPHLTPPPAPRRAASLELSQRTLFRSAHRGGVAWLDLDHVERRYLLSCATDASIAVYDTAPAAPGAGPREALAVVRKAATPGAHQSAVSGVAWYPVDTGIFLSGARDGEVKVWDANSLVPVAAFPIGSPVHAVAMSPAGAAHCLAAVGSSDADVLLADVVAGGVAQRLSGHRAGVWALAWSPTSEWELLTGGRDGQVRAWDVRRAGALAVLDVSSTKRKQAVAAAGGAGADERNGGSGRGAAAAATATAALTKAHGAGVTGLTPTPDGLFWLTAGNDDALRLWNAGSYRHELVHYSGAYNRATKPRQLAVTDDGGAAFCPSGSAVLAYEVASGKLLASLTGGHFESVNCCVWGPGGGELYTGANDHSIVAWAPREAARLDGGDDKDADKDAWSD